MSFPAAMNPGSQDRPTLPRVVPRTLNGGDLSRKLHTSALAGVVRAVPTAQWWQQRVGERRYARTGRRNVLIVGAGPLGREVADILQRERSSVLTVVGFLDDSAVGADSVLGGVGD